MRVLCEPPPHDGATLRAVFSTVICLCKTLCAFSQACFLDSSAWIVGVAGCGGHLVLAVSDGVGAGRPPFACVLKPRHALPKPPLHFARGLGTNMPPPHPAAHASRHLLGRPNRNLLSRHHSLNRSAEPENPAPTP